ncbi:hypothetical protein Tco_1204370 [Tanacetum coccineum]
MERRLHGGCYGVGGDGGWSHGGEGYRSGGVVWWQRLLPWMVLLRVLAVVGDEGEEKCGKDSSEKSAGKGVGHYVGLTWMGKRISQSIVTQKLNPSPLCSNVEGGAPFDPEGTVDSYDLCTQYT